MGLAHERRSSTDSGQLVVKTLLSVSLVEVIRKASKMSPQALNAWFYKSVWPALPAIIYVIYVDYTHSRTEYVLRSTLNKTHREPGSVNGAAAVATQDCIRPMPS